ncbi:phage protein Gp27 family protein [Sphingomonas sp. ERG5]|uniref:phage protein Gp27 family protein n=1 Tax=Sphingomonas sp. ERG5 TaxID=1381597 RepID=UPI00068999FC|nr:phage protein Gp27 family protein [Sphingomonas sp. ERG5]
MAESAQDRREGRGRLSMLDTLPDAAEPDIVWALEALRERGMPQNAILDEFNSRLADRGIAKVSKSSFSRWSVRKAIQFRKLDEVRAITNDIVASLGTADADEVTVAVAELLKAQIYEQVEKGELTPKAIKELAVSLKEVVNAQRSSTEHRRKLEERQNAMVERVTDRSEEVLREAGLGTDRIAELRREFLGVRSNAS